jgi:four helix bundle protein
MILRMQRRKPLQRLQRQIPNKPLTRQGSIPNQIPNKVSNSNDQMEDSVKRRDLEDRTFQFAQSVRAFVKQLPRTISNNEDVRQLVRASGSVAANWIEADEALSKKDFLMRVKICRKEAKESRLFLRLIDTGLAKGSVNGRDALSAEARELVLIFSSIISKSGGL